MSKKGGWNCLEIVTKPDIEASFQPKFFRFSLGVHLEVDEGVDGGVGHGQPEEGKEDVLCACVSS